MRRTSRIFFAYTVGIRCDCATGHARFDMTRKQAGARGDGRAPGDGWPGGAGRAVRGACARRALRPTFAGTASAMTGRGHAQAGRGRGAQKAALSFLLQTTTVCSHSLENPVNQASGPGFNLVLVPSAGVANPFKCSNPPAARARVP